MSEEVKCKPRSFGHPSKPTVWQLCFNFSKILDQWIQKEHKKTFGYYHKTRAFENTNAFECNLNKTNKSISAQVTFFLAKKWVTFNFYLEHNVKDLLCVTYQEQLHHHCLEESTPTVLLFLHMVRPYDFRRKLLCKVAGCA